MTAVTLRRPRRPRWPSLAVAAAPAIVGLAALLGRPWFLPHGVALGWRVAFFLALGAVGLAWSLEGTDAPAGRRVTLAALALGTLAFVGGRALVDVPLPPGQLGVALALNGLAAVAEEMFFRRYLYGLLAPFGTAVAIVVSASAFAVAHVTVWGWWVLPLDLAAGLVLSWQRAASGRWSVPAATHVLANSLALL